MLQTRAPAQPRPAERRVRRDSASAEPPPGASQRAVGWADPAMLLIVAVAFGLRMWQLGYKSLWLDEGISVSFAQDGPPRLFQVLIERDLHPPLYYLALWAWMEVGGRSEWAVRFPSVLVGVLLVALIYRFARQLYPGTAGRATGLLAAALATLSPFLIYYSQEARMYGALAAAGLAATIALRWALEGRAHPVVRWGVYAVLMALPPYLQHLGWMLFGFHGAFVVLTALRYRRRALGWPVAVLAVVVAYLPWVGPAARQVTRLRDTPDFWQGALSLWFVAQHAFAAFAVGFGGALERYAFVLAAFVAAFVLGAAVVAWRGLLRGRSGDLLVFLYLALPTAMLYVVVASNPKFADRYLILVVPPFLLLLARGIVGIGELGARLRQRIAPLGLALVGLSGLFAVGMVGISAREGLRVYRDEPYAKEDYRGAVAYLIDHWQTGDAVLLMLDSADVFEYYSHGKLTHYPMNPTDDLQFAATELNKVVAQGHGRLWLLMWNPDWADPSGAVRAMMDETLERVPLELESFFHLPVRLYSLADHPSFDARPQPPIQLDTRFGDALKLLGADLGGDALTPSGTTRQVRLFWEPLRQIPDELSVSLRLTRGGREWWRWDGPPAAHSYPTTYWKPGRSVRGGFKVEVPAGTPPGEYDLSLVVYNPREKAPLIARTGDRTDAEIRLGTVRVGPPTVPPDPAALPIPSRAQVEVDGAALVASDLRQQSVDAGGTLDLALGWRLTGAPGERLEELWLVDAAGKAWPLGAAPPVDGQYPTATWRSGEVVVDRLTVAVPPGAAAGAATLRTALRPAAGAGSPDRAAEVGRFEVRARAHEMRPPSPRASLQARVGDFAELVGVDAPADVARGETAKLALYWRGRAETRQGYTVFVHLIGADEKPIAQRDAVPGDGALPTTGWVVGEYLRDEYSLAVPSDAPPGSYRVAVGMYDRRTGQRLPVEAAAGRDPGNRAVVATVVVR